jgi:MATE family multidrug resistance protein
MTPWTQELRTQLRLAIPVVVIQVGLMAMGAVDGAFLGRVDPVQYAASSIGHSLTFVFFAFGMGVLTVLDPVVSQAFGARDDPAISRAAQRGVVLALLMSIPIALVILPADTILDLIGQSDEVSAVAGPYARILILSAPPFLIFVALRQVLQATHLMRPLVLTIFATNGLNAFLDWVLIFGNLGAPEMGAIGSAWATVISRWSMIAVLPLLAGKSLTRYLTPRADRLFDFAAYGRMLRIGLPVGVQWFVEVGAFASVTALMGSLGAVELAGHQVAMHLASGSFMIPLGISMAASVRVGNEIGRGAVEGVQRAARVSLVCGAGVMAVIGIVFMASPYALARIFTDLDEVLAMAILLVPVAGVFQIFDGTQVVAVGILRGMGDTRVPMLVHVAGFWGVAMPIACWAAFGLDYGAVGLWYGLVAGLAVVAVAQFLRLRWVLRQRLERIVIDAPEDISKTLPR